MSVVPGTILWGKGRVMNPSVTATSSLEAIKHKRLGEASCQEIQLELIRRLRFNAFDGARVAAALLEHRDLWQAVMMDRVSISNPGRLPALGMVKLRDLPDNDWNVDTLYILTRDQAAAEKLAEIFNMRKWGGMVSVHAEPEDVDNALGGAEPGQAIVTIWWD